MNYSKNFVVDSALQDSFEALREELKDETDQLIVEIMTIFLDLEREILTNSTVRNFVKFIKKLKKKLEGNPLSTFFHKFLMTRRGQILAAFESTPVRECRKKSFTEILTWLSM